MVIKKSLILILNAENKYKFCGLPIGVSILPKLAAIVSMVIIHTSLSVLSESFNAVIVKGTKVIRATSLVITIDEKKQSNPNIRESPEMLFTFESIFSAINLKTPILLSPAITAIRQNNSPNVRKSIYSKYLTLGVTKNAEITAKTKDNISTISFFIKSLNLVILYLFHQFVKFTVFIFTFKNNISKTFLLVKM